MATVNYSTRVEDGTKTAPSYSFRQDTDTGVYRIGANNIGISCGDTKVFDIAAAVTNLTGALTVGPVDVSSYAAAIGIGQNITTGTGNSRAFVDNTTFARATGTAAYNSFDGVPTFSGTTNFDHTSVFQCRPNVNMTGTMTNLYGYYYLPGVAAAATVTTTYGTYIDNIGAGGSVGTCYGHYVAELTKGGTANWAIYTVGATKSAFAGAVFIGDTANTGMTLGLTINQGANDNEILALKSSDVSHGMTTDAETDTYATFGKHGINDGGLAIRGFTDTTGGLALRGVNTTDGAAKTTGATGAVYLAASLKTGTTYGDCGANANLVVIRNGTTGRFIFDAEGSGHADVEWVTY